MYQPNFEKPINTPEDLIEKNMTLFQDPGGEYWIQFLANSPIPEYNTLSKSMVIAKDWDQYYHLTKSGIIGNGTHATMDYYLSPWRKYLGRWWQGDLVLGDFQYAGYLSDKKWYLNEAFVIFNLTCILPLIISIKITNHYILHIPIVKLYVHCPLCSLSM